MTEEEKRKLALSIMEQERQRQIEQEQRLLKEQQEKEAREREMQRQKDLFALRNYTAELVSFNVELPKQLAARKSYNAGLQQAQLQRERNRQIRKEKAGMSGR